jgi:hypothetical protein
MRWLGRLVRGRFHRRLTVAEWVRQRWRAVGRREPSGDTVRKLGAVRTAARHAFPSGDIATMLAEIERGYTETPNP